MKRNWNLWIAVGAVLPVLIVVGRSSEEMETAVCDFTEQTAVPVNIRKGKGEPSAAG